MLAILQLCRTCLSSHPGGACPVPQCKAVAHTKDYKPATQTAQVSCDGSSNEEDEHLNLIFQAALAVENIQRLLGGDKGGGEEEEETVEKNTLAISSEIFECYALWAVVFSECLEA